LNKDDELLTRIDASVHVNKEGVPIYQTEDRGLASRFVDLLRKYGDVHLDVYNRSVYEVRYPKFLHEILDKMDYEENLPALIDEKGFIDQEAIKIDNRAIPPEEFDGVLYSRSKRLSLALALGDSDQIAEIMSEESQVLEKLL